MRTRLVLTALVGTATLISGCNIIMDLSRFNEAPRADAGDGDQKEAGDIDAGDAGAVTETGSVDKRFACLHSPNEPLDPSIVTWHVTIANSHSATQTADTIDGGSGLDLVVYKPTSGVTVKSCLTVDPGCANPVVNPAVTDNAGKVDLNLPGNFIGYFHGTGAGIVPFNFFPGQWLTGLTEASYFTESSTPADDQVFNAVIGGQVDLDAGLYGIVLFVIFDCFDHTVEGTTFALSRTGSEMLPFYLIGGVPTTTVQVTDKSGVGGAVNVPAGSLRATATFLATSTTLGTSDVYVSPGEYTIAWIRMRTH